MPKKLVNHRYVDTTELSPIRDIKYWTDTRGWQPGKLVGPIDCNTLLVTDTNGVVIRRGIDEVLVPVVLSLEEQQEIVETYEETIQNVNKMKDLARRYPTIVDKEGEKSMLDNFSSPWRERAEKAINDFKKM